MSSVTSSLGILENRFQPRRRLIALLSGPLVSGFIPAAIASAVKICAQYAFGKKRVFRYDNTIRILAKKSS